MRKIISAIIVLHIFLAMPLFSTTVISKAPTRKSVTVTVYNNGQSLVREVRDLDIPKGEGELRFEGIPKTINSASVLAKSISAPKKFEILEQNYEYDLMNQNKLLDKFVGKEIKILTTNQFKDSKKIITATLLSNNSGQIYKIDNEIYLGHDGVKILPKVPENLIATPTLMWKYKNNYPKKQDIEVTYLTDNLSWKADYVLSLTDDKKNSDLTGWVTIDNRCGATFKNSGLKLVAGDVNRVFETRHQLMATKGLSASSTMYATDNFQEKTFFEYHLYTLPRKTTLKNNQSKQIKLLASTGITVEKELIVETGYGQYYRSVGSTISRPKVNVFVNIINTKKNSLGIPLPKGVVRIYKKDSDGSAVLVGEDRIEHTPVEEKLHLKLGKAFDVTVEKTQTNYEKVNQRTSLSSWKVVINNRKNSSVKVTLPVSLTVNAKIVKSSIEFKKKSTSLANFTVSIASKKSQVITYTVKVKQ